MGSLRKCLKKIGMPEHESAILRGDVKDYLDDGYGPQEAAVRAVKGYIESLAEERADVVKQLAEKGISIPLEAVTAEPADDAELLGRVPETKPRPERTDRISSGAVNKLDQYLKDNPEDRNKLDITITIRADGKKVVGTIASHVQNAFNRGDRVVLTANGPALVNDKYQGLNKDNITPAGMRYANWLQSQETSSTGEESQSPHSVQKIHALAESKNIPWDNDKAFMDFTESATGKRHLDDLTPEERKTVYDRLAERPHTKESPTLIPLPPELSLKLRSLSRVTENAQQAIRKFDPKPGEYEHVSRAKATTRNARAGQAAELWKQKQKDLGAALRAAATQGYEIPKDYIELAGASFEYDENGKYAPIRATATESPQATATEDGDGGAPAPASGAPDTKIEDFGETIAGSRKELAEAYKDKMREAEGADVATVPLSKSWPEPDYQKFLDSGQDAWIVAFIHAARDEIPTKPTKRWKVSEWVNRVEALRGFAGSILNGNISKDQVRAALGKKEYERLADGIMDRIDLYLEVGHGKSLKGVGISRGQYSIFNGKPIDPPKIIWTVDKKAAATALSNWPTQLASGDTREAAIADFVEKFKNNETAINAPAAKQVSFEIYTFKSGDKAGKYYIGKKIGKNDVDLEAFDTVKDARQYLANNRDKLIEKLDKLKYIPNERREENSPRVGLDHRNDADVSASQFQETFGFRGVQFGNYVEGAKRQADLNESYDALMDMAGVLGVPPKALSLNGELGLAFGARGKGAAGFGRGKAPKAHYESGHIVINLTKDKGAGSLAHEWWHGLDNYFSRMRGDKESFLTEKAHERGEGVRPEMVEAFKHIRQVINEAGLKARSFALDRTRTTPYWSTGREMTARAFESYVVEKLRDQGASNDYLANIVSEDYWNASAELGLEKEGTYPYPEAAEIPAVRAAYDRFFQAVETKETDQGIALLESDTEYVVNAPAAEYPIKQDEAKYETDLFGDRLPDKDRQRPKTLVSRNIRSATAVRSLEVKDKNSGTFAVETALVSERSRTIPVSKIRSVDDAATAFAYLYNYAVEHFDAIVTDKNGTPLAIVGSFKGTFNGTAVYPSVVVHEAFRIKGAANIWLSHNHPSGLHNLSRADEVLHDRVVPYFQGSKITLKGFFAIGDGGYTFRDNFGGLTSGNIKEPAAGVSTDIPVVERVFKKNDRLAAGIESVDAAKSVIPSISNGQAGLVLLDSRHRPVAFVPVSKEEAGMLRTKGRMDRLYRALSTANAAAAMIANPNKTYSSQEWRNLAGFVNSQEARALDTISYTFDSEKNTVSDVSSVSERGLDHTEKAFFSRANNEESSESTPVWYSALERGIESAKQNSMPAKQWALWLEANRAKLGIKQDEVDAVGLREYLELQTGTVTKEQVLSFARQNGVQVKEVTLGDQKAINAKVEARAQEIFDAEVSEITDRFQEENGEDADPSDAHNAASWPGAEQRAMEELGIDSETGDTKFSQWQLPGGENYREMLLTLPTKVSDSTRKAYQLRDATGVPYAQGDETSAQRWRREGKEVFEVDELVPSPKSRQRAIDGFRKRMFDKHGAGYMGLLTGAERAQFDSFGKEPEQTFRSQHFTEPNILAHVRFNERTDAEGKKVLFIEEVQSDWAQKGRKEGFDTDKPDSRDVAQNIENAKDWLRERGVNPEEDFGYTNPEDYVTLARSRGFQGPEPMTSNVTSAPFVTKTEAWSMLAMKRMIRYASENGFDKIAWTTGEQQAARYDLSKQVDEISAKKKGDNSYWIMAIKRDSGVVLEENEIPLSRVEELIGKDMVKRIGDQEQGEEKSYSGLDLKVGGKGMKDFYDQMLPQWVNKYVKRFGSKVGETNIARTPSVLEMMARPGRFEENTVPEIMNVHSLDITDSMRESVMQGQPLFAAAGKHWWTWKKKSNVVIHDIDENVKKRVAALEKAGQSAGEFTITSGSLLNTILERNPQDQDLKILKVLQDTFGTPVIMVKSDGKFKFAGVQYEGAIFLNTDSKKSLPIVFGHELSHAMERDNPKAYAALLNAVQPMLRNRDVYEKKSFLEGFSDKYIAKEMLGDLMGDRFGEQEFWQQVAANTSQTEFQKIITAIRLWLERAINRLKGRDLGSNAFVSDLEVARRIIAKAVASYAEFKKAGELIEEAQFSRTDRNQTDTQEFKKWFGESKVVDENGKPLRVYHGTSAEFTQFGKQIDTDGSFFTVEPRHANAYAGARQGSKVLPIYLSITNPLKMTSDEWYANKQNGHELGDQTQWIADGYDGLFIKDLAQQRGASDTWVSFFPTQIKSAIGNRGTFDPENADIRFSRKTEETATIPDGMPKGVIAAYTDRAKRVIGRIDKSLGPLGSLPNSREYLTNRYLTLGKIAKVDEIAKGIGKTFNSATPEDQVAVYDYLTTQDARPAGIRNELARADAVRVKALIESVGDALVARGLLSEEAHEAHRGAYLPQLYLKWLLNESDTKLLGAGKKPGPMGYLKGRKILRSKDTDGNTQLVWRESGKPLTDEQVLDFGPVLDPGFLASTAIATPVRDMAILDFLSTISQHEEWVLPNSLIEFDGTHTTPQWLKSEADRLRKQADHYSHEDATKARGMADRMETAANEALKQIGISAADLKDFEQVPNTVKYGRLRGLWIRKEIYEDLVGAYNMRPDKAGFAESLFGYGGTGTKITQLWKMSKVSLNPPAQVRNFVSNGVLLQLSGVPLHKVPVYILRAAKEVYSDGKYWRIAKKYGVTESTFSTQEVFHIKRDLLDLQMREGKLNTIGHLHRAGAIVADKASDAYQFSEALFKTAKIMHAMESGMSEGEAAIEAMKWLFDYSLVPKNVRYLRNAPIGMPFLTFQFKVLPRLAEVALLHPQRLIPWVVLFAGWPLLWAMMAGEDDDEYKRLQKALPQWLRERGHAMIMPFKDEEGRTQVVDLGYFMPWSMYTTAAQHIAKGEVGDTIKTVGLFSGPLTSVITATMTGKDAFTGRNIMNAGDPAGRQLVAGLNYTWDMMMPPIVGSRGLVSPIGLLDAEYGGKAVQAATGRTNKLGDPTATAKQAALYPFGLNVYSIDPEHAKAQNVMRLKYEVDQTEMAGKRKLQNRGLSDEARQEIVEEYKAEIQRRGKKIMEYQEK